MFIAAMFVTALVISIAGLANVRPRAWPYILRNPRGLTAVVYDWVWPPLVLGIFLLSSIFGRYFRSRSIPQNYERWGGGVFGVMAVLIVGTQLLETAAVFAHWYREAHPLAPRPAPGATFLGLLPDPEYLLRRAMMGIGGVFVAWMGNSMAKLVPPPLGRDETYDRGKKYRLNGWVFVLGGVVMALCAFLLPYPTTAVIGILLTCAVMVALQILVWLFLRFGADHARIEPDGEAW